MTKTPLTGGCACGKIKYESTAQPVAMLHCHCRDCQHSSGGPFSSFTVVPAESFTIIQGEPKIYATESEMGGKNHRGFCADCGSPLTSKPEGAPGIVGIFTSSLDDTSIFNLQMEVWVSDARPLDHLNFAIPNFEKYPTS